MTSNRTRDLFELAKEMGTQLISLDADYLLVDISGLNGTYYEIKGDTVIAEHPVTLKGQDAQLIVTTQCNVYVFLHAALPGSVCDKYTLNCKILAPFAITTSSWCGLCNGSIVILSCKAGRYCVTPLEVPVAELPKPVGPWHIPIAASVVIHGWSIDAISTNIGTFELIFKDKKYQLAPYSKATQPEMHNMTTSLKFTQEEEQINLELMVDDTKLGTLGYNTFTGAFNQYYKCETTRLSWTNNLVIATVTDSTVGWVLNLDDEHCKHVDTIMMGTNGSDVSEYLDTLGEVLRDIPNESIILPKVTLSTNDIHASLDKERCNQSV